MITPAKALTVSLSIAIALSLLPMAASAQAPLKIGVVDLQRALLAVPDGRQAKGRLEKLAARKQKELEGKKATLEKKHEEFKRQGALLTEAVRRERLEELQRLKFELQKLAFEYERELKEKEVKMLRPISEKLEKTIGKVAKSKGLAVVLHAAGVAYHLPAIDITDDVIKQYGK